MAKKAKKYTEGELEKLAKDAAAWVASEEGKKVIRETLRKADELERKLEEAHRADPRSLLIPFTI